MEDNIRGNRRDYDDYLKKCMECNRQCDLHSQVQDSINDYWVFKDWMKGKFAYIIVGIFFFVLLLGTGVGITTYSLARSSDAIQMVSILATKYDNSEKIVDTVAAMTKSNDHRITIIETNMTNFTNILKELSNNIKSLESSLKKESVN